VNQPPQDQHAERERFFGATRVVAGLTMLSRVFGMVRDMAITSLGASRMTSAFVLAFKIPNLFRRLFGEGALSAAFVPVFSETDETGGFEKARRLFANALGLLAVTTSAIVVAIWLALLVWGGVFPGQPDRQLLLRLLGLMLPFTVTTCLLALGSAALNCKGRFAYPAFAPVLLNIFVILAAWAAAPMWRQRTETQLTVIAASVTAAGLPAPPPPGAGHQAHPQAHAAYAHRPGLSPDLRAAQRRDRVGLLSDSAQRDDRPVRPPAPAPAE